MSESSRPRVGVVIVNHNQKALLRACLRSWKAQDYPDFDLLVSDNASSDGAQDMLRSEFPEVTLLAHPRELGFAGAASAGLKAMAEGRPYLFLTTNDTEVDPDMLSRLVEAAEADPNTGVLGPKILYFEERGLIWHAGGYIDKLFGNPGHYGFLCKDDGAFDSARDCDFVTGCGFLIRTDAGSPEGFLDPSLGFYAEDTDFCVRLLKKGWKIRYVPTARMYHHISATLGTDSALSAYYSSRNILALLNRRRWGWWPLPVLLFAGVRLPRFTWGVWRRNPDKGKAYARATWLGIRDFALGHYGMRDPQDPAKPFQGQ